jgi:hypothetical protein
LYHLAYDVCHSQCDTHEEAELKNGCNNAWTCD